MGKVIKTPFYYGWVIVIVAGLGIFFSGPGQTYSISIFIDSYIEEFDYSRSYVSNLYSIATLIAGFLLFSVGKLADLYGQRLMMTIVGVGLAFTTFWNSMLTGPIMMFLGFFMLRIFGQGSMTLLPNTLVPQWFLRKRGRAFSIMAIGSFASAAAFPAINYYLIQELGWRTTWVILGVALLVVFVPIVIIFVRNKPEDIGEVIDGNETEKRANESKLKDSIDVDSEVSWTLKEAAKTRAFWAILFCVSVPAMTNTGITFHLLSIVENKGIPEEVAAIVLSLMAIIGFPVTFVSGYLADRFKVNYVLAITFFIHVIAIGLLLFVNSTFWAIVYGVLWGICNGFERISLNIIWPDYFGRTHLGSIKSIAQSTMVIGSALGPLPFGYFYEWFNGYEEIIFIMLFFPAIAMVLSILSPKPDYNQYHA